MESMIKTIKEDGKENLPAEAILYDLLDKIFSHLSLKDLHRVSAVCKSWQHIANKEISRRNNIQSLILPITSDPEDDDDDDDDDDGCTFKYLQNKWHISDSLRSLPELVLLFSDGNGPIHPMSDHFFLYYSRRLKCGTRIADFDALGVSMDNTEVIGTSNLGVGIMIPSTPNLKIDLYTPDDTNFLRYVKNNEIPKFTDQVLNSLLTTEEEHNCFLFFINRFSVYQGIEISSSISFLSEFQNSLKKRCKPGTYSLWGGEVAGITTNINDFYDHNAFVWSLLFRISGPAVNSWSIVLKSNLSNAEIEDKLLNLKRNMHLKSNSVAIAMVPSNKQESFKQRLSTTEMFRKVFSKIPLIGIYEPEEYIRVGVNSLDCDSNPVLEHRNSITYLIITTE